jgi:hypothetical protein
VSVANWGERFAAWFEGRSWRVMAEKTGTVTAGSVRVTYDKGAFEISPPGVYSTPLGNRGRRGYLVIETGPDGRDVPGTAAAFGEATLRRAWKEYGLVSGLPEEG